MGSTGPTIKKKTSSFSKGNLGDNKQARTFVEGKSSSIILIWFDNFK
jgi:hypothetical protein